MEHHKVVKLDESTYLITDPLKCACYLLLGSKQAILIDTGIDRNPYDLKKIVQEITKLDVIVLLTHGHFDHSGHVNQFDSFYMFKEDEYLFENKRKQLLSTVKYLNDNDSFDIGNRIINVKLLPGHTPGSCVFIDTSHHFIYTGDDFGSGCGVWMQVNGALPLSKYINSIDKFLSIEKIESYTLLPGHPGQEYDSKVSKYNPLTISLVKDMKELSKLLIDNKITLEESKATSFENETSYYARYKTAEMIIRKSLIK